MTSIDYLNTFRLFTLNAFLLFIISEFHTFYLSLDTSMKYRFITIRDRGGLGKHCGTEKMSNLQSHEINASPYSRTPSIV